MEFMGQRIYEVHENEAAQVNVAKKVTLANLLPSISRQAHLVISGNEYLNVSNLIYILWSRAKHYTNVYKLDPRHSHISKSYMHSLP